MEDVNGMAQENSTPAEANATAPVQETITTEQLLQQVSKLTSTNDRLLEESKKYKSQSYQLGQKLETAERSHLEKNQEYKELYEKTKEQLTVTRADQRNSAIAREVYDAALKAGCTNPDHLLKIMGSDSLQVDENGDVHGLDLMIDKAKEEAAYLFQSKNTPVINSITPSGEYRTEGKKNYNAMNKDELWSEINNLDVLNKRR